MRILHVGPFKLGTSNGNYNALWALARAQADVGHDVSIVRVGKAVAPPDQAVADAFGVRLLGFPCPRWRGLWHDDAGVLARSLDEVRPELVHLSYGFRSSTSSAASFWSGTCRTSSPCTAA